MASTSRTLVLAVAVAALASGCSSFISAPGGSGSPGGSAAPAPADRLHAQARDALERWAAAVRDSGGASITFTGDLTSQLGEWEPAVGENNKEALMAGMVVATTPLSDDVPGRRQVRWTDGPAVDVKVLSARDALAALVAEAPAPSSCADCRPLQVREANLATALVETSTGPAEAPVWVFSLQGTAVRLTRVAVDGSVTVTPPPWNADDPPEGIAIEMALGTPDSTSLEVQFVGAVERGDKPCGADYTAEAVESDLAVVVIVTERGHKGDAGGCAAVGKVRTARAELAAPLGDRAVLEVRQGLPVPVHAP